MPDLSQNHLNKTISRWQNHHRLYPPLPDKGHCFGLSLWWIHAKLLKRDDEFWRILNVVASSVILPAKDDNDFTTYCNNVAWLQNDFSYDAHQRQQSPLSLLKTLFAKSDTAYPIGLYFSEYLKVKKDTLKNVILLLLDKPAVYRFGANQHSVALSVNSENIELYDPNSHERIIFKLDTAQPDIIANHLIAALACGKKLPSELILKLQVFCHQANALSLKKIAPLQLFIYNPALTPPHENATLRYQYWLYEACRTDQLPLLKGSLRGLQKAVIYLEQDRYSPLDVALKYLSLKCIKYLLTSFELSDYTPSYLAQFIKAGRVDIIELLLPYLKEKHLRLSKAPYDAINLAMRCQQVHVALSLIKKFPHHAKFRQTALLQIAIDNEQINIIDLLTKEDKAIFDNNELFKDIYGLIAYALRQKKSAAFIEKLVKLKGINQLSFHESYQVYHFAVHHHLHDVIDALIKGPHGYLLRGETRDLVYAMDHHNRELALKLIAHKKSVCFKAFCYRGVTDKKDKLAVRAFLYGYYDFFKDLLQQVSNMAMLNHFSSRLNNQDIIALMKNEKHPKEILGFLLKNDIISNTWLDSSGNTLLHIAILYGHSVETIEYILAQGSYSVLDKQNVHGQSPLAIAIEQENSPALKLLLKKCGRLPFSLYDNPSLFEKAISKGNLREVVSPYLVKHIEHILEIITSHTWTESVLRSYLSIFSTLETINYQGQAIQIPTKFAPVVRKLICLQKLLPTRVRRAWQMAIHAYDDILMHLREHQASLPAQIISKLNHPLLEGLHYHHVVIPVAAS